MKLQECRARSKAPGGILVPGGFFKAQHKRPPCPLLHLPFAIQEV